MSLRIFLVDDHDVVRRGLTALIDAEDDLEVVGTSSSAAGTLDAIAATKPDVSVLDVRLGDGNGVEVCRDIRSAHPKIACLTPHVVRGRPSPRRGQPCRSCRLRPQTSPGR